MRVVINASYVGRLKSKLSLMHLTLENLDQSCREGTLRWKIEAGVVTQEFYRGNKGFVVESTSIAAVAGNHAIPINPLETAWSQQSTVRHRTA